MLLQSRMLLLLSVIVAKHSLVVGFSQSLDSDFTFTLPAGQKECFYQTMKKDASLEIEYQVVYIKFTPFLIQSHSLLSRVIAARTASRQSLLT